MESPTASPRTPRRGMSFYLSPFQKENKTQSAAPIPPPRDASLNMASPEFQSKINRRASMIFRNPNSDKKARVEVIDKLRRDASYTFFPEEQLKLLVRQLCDITDFEKKFFNVADLEEYNKTHGDGLKVSSTGYWKQHYINLVKQRRKLINTTTISNNNSNNKDDNKSKTINNNNEAQQQQKLQDETIWKEIEKDVRPHLWKLYEVRLILTTGFKLTNKSTLSAPCSPSTSPRQSRSNTMAKEDPLLLRSMYRLNYNLFQQTHGDYRFGVPYVALQIGHQIIEWNKNSLCIPHDADSYLQSVPGIVELPFLKMAVVTQEDVHKVASIITDWNANKNYDLSSCNSQQFIDVILTTLGMDPVFGGNVGSFLKGLQGDGSLKQIDWKFKYEGKVHSIRTHRDLDKLCSDIVNMKTLSVSDSQMLMVYDRLFWVLWSAFSDAKDLTKDEQELKARATSCKDCNFGWPWAEGSISERPNPFSGNGLVNWKRNSFVL